MQTPVKTPVKVTLRGHSQLHSCPDCRREHLGPPCGASSYAERLRSVRLDGSATPNKTKKNYFDQESVSSIFGDDAEDRMMEETEGLGPVTPQELRENPQLAQDIAAYYGADHRDAALYDE